jgi:hypothetical protein
MNGRGNRSTGRKPAPAWLCPPQTPHDLIGDRTRAAAMRSRRPTAWATARPSVSWYGASSHISAKWLQPITRAHFCMLWWHSLSVCDAPLQSVVQTVILHLLPQALRHAVAQMLRREVGRITSPVRSILGLTRRGHNSYASNGIQSRQSWVQYRTRYSETLSACINLFERKLR